MIWHNATESQVENELRTSMTLGLSNDEVELRLKEFGNNKLNVEPKNNFATFLIDELKRFQNIAILVISFINYFLAIATDIANAYESLTVIVAVLLSILICTSLKYLSETVFKKSRSDNSTLVTVIRNGVEISVKSSSLVPGDIMLIKSGDYIKADGRLIDSYALTCDESLVSGDIAPSEKLHNALYEDITDLVNRHNMVYSGSYVLNGNGKVIVTETGLMTEIGMSKDMEYQFTDNETILSEKLNKTKHYVSITAIILSFIVFTLGIIFNFSNTDVSFAYTVSSNVLLALALYFSVGVNLIPSIRTFARAAAIYRLKNKGIIINNESATENLKDVTVVCADKTGVLTTEEQTVVKVFNTLETIEIDKTTLDDSSAAVLRLSLICSNFKHNEHGERHTNNIERAIESACIKHMGMSKSDVDGLYPKIAEIPFSSDRMLMTTVTVINGNPVSITKGAPEVILNKCSNLNVEKTNELVSSYAKEGLRVIAVAIKQLSEIPANPNPEELENDLSFMGIIGIEDNISEKAAKVCKEAKEFGIKTIMVTGDHLDTAVAISLKAGIINNADEAISGEDLSKLSDSELNECISKYSVFARITPEDKLRIVNALKENGEKVLITGDSTNDMNALNAADFGCALGHTASDLVVDASDILVKNNHYSAIIAAIKESRKVVANIKKALLYLLTIGLSFTALTIIGLLIFGIQPLSASALIIGGIILIPVPVCAILQDESFSSNIKFTNKILSKSFLLKLALPSFILVVLSLITFGICKGQDIGTAGSTAFLVLSFGLLSQALCAIINGSILNGEILKQKNSLLISLFSIVLVLLVILTPISTLLTFSSVSALGWLFGLITFTAVFAANEFVKFKY